MKIKERAIQIFTDEQIENGLRLSPSQIADFLQGYQLLLTADEGPRKLISLRIPENLLENFKRKCQLDGEASYQRKIVDLIREYLK